MMPMSSPPEAVEQVIARIRAVYRNWKRETPIAQMREDWDRFLWSDAVPAHEEVVSADGVPARWICAHGASSARTLIYLHGGGYKMGSVASHRDLMARLSQAGNCRVLGVDYRLLPEAPFPAPFEDALRAYRWALGQGIASTQLALAGDSAGGGLVPALLLALRDARTPLPACGVMLSALTDFEASGASYETRAAADPIHNRALIQALARQYLGVDGDRRDPRASPLYGDLHGLPPLLLQVGDRETGLDDSVLFAERARAAGVDATLEIWQGMIHVFQQFPDELVEARAAIDSIGRFLTRHWSSM